MDISQQEAEKLLKSIIIPARPAILDVLNREARQSEPNPAKFAQLIGKDVSLSAAMLKTVNSPLFGLSKRVASVPQALAMLGSNNTINIITGLALKNAMRAKQNQQLDRFWDNAAQEAMVSAFIARRLPGAQPDAAYTFGLFQNCGSLC